ncbi:hypothetical protein [Bacteroides acidifaciens]|nr:hypothetical protein [Bacteroides acidifaciens]
MGYRSREALSFAGHNAGNDYFPKTFSNDSLSSSFFTRPNHPHP